MTIPRILTGIILLAFGVPCVAGINSFTPTGPDGGVTYDIEFTGGGALLVTTPRAIYRSTDGGANWTRTRLAESWAPNHLAVNPANRNQVLFGSVDGLARSIDGGVTWTSIASPAAQPHVSVGIIEFAADGSVAWMAPQNGGIFYSTSDLGANWTAIDTGRTSHLFSIAADPVNPQLLYILTRDGSFVSSNGGSTLTPLAFAGYVGIFAASRTTANTVLATTTDDYRIYLSTNGGASWAPTATQPAPGRSMNLVQYVPGIAGKVIAMDYRYQMLRTLDNGQHWDELGPAPNGQIYSLAFDPANPTHIFAATYGGVFETTDDGATWTERTRGLREGSARKVVVSRGGAGATYLQTWDLASVYRRVADTGAWTSVGAASVPLLGLPASYNATFGYTALGASQQNPQLLYMVRELKFGVSNDGGVTWALRSAVDDMQSMEVSPTNDQHILMGNPSQPPIRTVNGGVSWESLGSHGLPSGSQRFAFDPVNTNVVYAAVDNYIPPAATAVYKSVDGGANFAPTPWSATLNPSIVWRLVHDPARTNIVYLSAYHGLYKTTDGGATWTLLPLFNDSRISAGAIDLIIDPQSPDILYASAFQRPWLARSVNGGASWDVVPESDAFENFGSIALVPGTRSKLVAVRWGGSREIEFATQLAAGVSAQLVTVNAPASTVLSASNRGVIAASAVRLTATLPASSTTHTVQSSSGTCTVATLALTCDFGTLAVNANATVTVGYTPTTAGTWSATVSAYEPDDNAADNTTQVTMSVPTPPPAAGGSGGGGGRLDYLLLALLLAMTMAREHVRFRARQVAARTR